MLWRANRSLIRRESDIATSDGRARGAFPRHVARHHIQKIAVHVMIDAANVLAPHGDPAPNTNAKLATGRAFKRMLALRRVAVGSFS
jgi:hypothetical protein